MSACSLPCPHPGDLGGLSFTVGRSSLQNVMLRRTSNECMPRRRSPSLLWHIGYAPLMETPPRLPFSGILGTLKFLYVLLHGSLQPQNIQYFLACYREFPGPQTSSKKAPDPRSHTSSHWHPGLAGDDQRPIEAGVGWLLSSSQFRVSKCLKLPLPFTFSPEPRLILWSIPPTSSFLNPCVL